MRDEDAQIIGIRGLEFLASEPDRFATFLGRSGMSALDIHQFAGQKETIIGILDFLLSDEELLLAFCKKADLAPEAPKTARMILSKEDYF